MNKTISQQDWNTLRYPISLRQLSEEEGGGWLATIPMLGQAAFAADGESPEEALQELETLRRDLYEDIIASGQPIPMPQDVTEKKLPSGKWIIRTSPSFHAELQEAAKVSGLSFNAYCNHVLERGYAVSSMYFAVHEVVQALAENIQITTPTVTGNTSTNAIVKQGPMQAVYQNIAPGYSSRLSAETLENSYRFNTTSQTQTTRPKTQSRLK